MAVWHVIPARKSDIQYLTRKESSAGFCRKSKLEAILFLPVCDGVILDMRQPNEGTSMWKDISFLDAAILPDAQGSTPCSPHLKRKGWDSKKQNPFTMRTGPALIAELCICQAEPSAQPGCPAEAFIPPHTVHHMDGLLLQGMCLCIPASPQPSPPCRDSDKQPCTQGAAAAAAQA